MRADIFASPDDRPDRRGRRRAGAAPARTRLATEAMATRFELALHGDDPVRLRAAGEEALREIERIERRLSAYRADSEIAAVNARAADAPVRVSPEVMRLLLACHDVWRASEGVFDIAMLPLMRAWRFVGASGAWPRPGSLEPARAVSGMEHVELDAEAGTVRFDRDGVSLDFGAVGKGYAIDVAIGVLADAGVTSALLHGGASSVHAIGGPPGADGWTIALAESDTHAAPRTARTPHPAHPAHPDRSISSLRLHDSALSVSAVHGKSFVHEGREYGHVIDPRTGEPARLARRAWVTGPSSLLCDALSTALLVAGPAWAGVLTERWPGYLGAAEG